MVVWALPSAAAVQNPLTARAIPVVAAIIFGRWLHLPHSHSENVGIGRAVRKLADVQWLPLAKARVVWGKMPFGLIVLAFNIWMLVDAIRRGADYYWFLIIAFIPGGALIYFFFVRMRDPDVRQASSRLKEIVARPVPVETLQARFDESHSAANEIALAQGLGEAGRWQEASQHFENVLKGRPKDPEALLGYGVSLLESERFAEAVAPLSRLVDDHPAYRDYAAYPELGAAYEKLGQPDEAVELFRSLHRQSPRLRHAVWLAEALLATAETSEAKELLETALRRSDDGPAHTKKADRQWRKQAEQMLG